MELQKVNYASNIVKHCGARTPNDSNYFPVAQKHVHKMHQV